MKKSKNSQIAKKDCLNIMKELHPNETLSNTSGDYNKLKFRYLDNLENEKLIDIKNKPRGKITFTEEGSFTLEIFSAYYGLE